MRTLPCTGRPTPRLLRACAIFRLGLTRVESRSLHPAAAIAHARLLDQYLAPGERALLTGPSGSGKSTLLRALTSILPRGSVVRVREVEPRLDSRFVVDALGASLPATLDLLSRAGLADALLLPRRVHELSGGERARLALARAFRAALRRQRPGRVVTILADEFASLLDRETARSLCLGLAHRTPPGLRFIAASAHADVIDWLAPHVLACADAPPRRTPRTGGVS